MKRLGSHQLRRLIFMASPAVLAISGDRTNRSLVKLGYLRETYPGGASCVTPVGLCALAEQMIAGRVDAEIEAMQQERKAGIEGLR